MRHAGRERWTTNQNGDRARIVGKEHRGLAGGIAAADQKDIESARSCGLGARGAVVNPTADQRLGADDFELAPAHAVGDHDRARIDAGVAVQQQSARGIAWIGDHADDVACDDDLGAEALRLLQRAIAELVACDAGREPEVIFDP